MQRSANVQNDGRLPMTDGSQNSVQLAPKSSQATLIFIGSQTVYFALAIIVEERRALLLPSFYQSVKMVAQTAPCISANHPPRANSSSISAGLDMDTMSMFLSSLLSRSSSFRSPLGISELAMLGASRTHRQQTPLSREQLLHVLSNAIMTVDDIDCAHCSQCLECECTSSSCACLGARASFVAKDSPRRHHPSPMGR